MSEVYAIINEFTPKGSDYDIVEILQPLRNSYQEILDDLYDLALEFDTAVDEDETMISVPRPDSHLESDTYYIMNLEVLTRG